MSTPSGCQLIGNWRIVFFNWDGSDEGTEISGSESAELNDDGSLEIEIKYNNGDDVILKAQRT